MLCVVDILDHHHPDEVRVVAVMVKGEGDEFSQSVLWRQVIEVEGRFAFADFEIGQPPSTPTSTTTKSRDLVTEALSATEAYDMTREQIDSN